MSSNNNLPRCDLAALNGFLGMVGADKLNPNDSNMVLSVADRLFNSFIDQEDLSWLYEMRHIDVSHRVMEDMTVEKIPNIRLVSRSGGCYYFRLKLNYHEKLLSVTKDPGVRTALRMAAAKVIRRHLERIVLKRNIIIPSTEYGNKVDVLVEYLDRSASCGRSILELGLAPTNLRISFTNGVSLRKWRKGRATYGPDYADLPQMVITLGNDLESIRCELSSVLPDIPIELFVVEATYESIAEQIKEHFRAIDPHFHCTVESFQKEIVS